MAEWGFRQRWGVLLLGLVSLLLVSADARAGCETDMECKGDRICRAGECVDPDESQGCEMDNDCPGDQLCRQGACEPTTGEEEDEPESQAGRRPLADGRCASDLDCPVDQSCADTQCRARMQRRSTGAMIAGAVLVPAGGAAAIAGVILAAVLASTPNEYAEYRSSKDEFGENPGGPVVLWIAGGVALAVGIPLLIHGIGEVPVDGEEQTDSAVTIEPLIGPTGGGVRVRF